LYPNLGIIALKFFQGLPLGSLRKNLTISISISFCLVAPFNKTIHPASARKGEHTESTSFLKPSTFAWEEYSNHATFFA